MITSKKTKLYMDTVVDIQVVTDSILEGEAEVQINRAFDSFRKVEQACSRFSPESELMQACQKVRTPVQLSPVLFEPIKFALEVSKLTDGIFDPTIGKVMEEHGFNRHYLTGERIESPSEDAVTYKDIILDEQARTIYLRKPLIIDLGAVAKGFAIDMAANQLKMFEGFVINAGGDLFAHGMDENKVPWKVGIQHPKLKDKIIDVIDMSNAAMCTSGSYERRSMKTPNVHHLINPKTKQSPNQWVSCSIIAPFAMMADVFSTVVFLLDINNGKIWIEEMGIKGILISNDLQVVKVGGI